MANKFLNIEVSGVKELLSKVKNLDKAIIQGLDDEMTAAAQSIRTNALRLSPSNYSALRQRIEALTEVMLNKNVVVLVNYAAYVEFGTGTLVDVPPGLEEYAIQFKGKGIKQVNLPAHPFLFPAFKEETKKLLPILTLVIQDELDKL